MTVTTNRNDNEQIVNGKDKRTIA